MAVVGVGIDVVDISRFDEALRRTPGLVGRLFTPAEATRPLASLAARFAAKEALAKALGAPGDLEWHDAEVVSEPTGRPRLDLRGTVAARAAELGATSVHLSLSHDAGIASAVVVMES
ncbi:MAG TPA: holo-ACP synthase [Nocardioides sp.]|uniref:holo-ACP synthase n=1 Tax=Nocardioides sp. TaxID=35761 RepID=UPI002E338089|nr:holo-ACP synthase [Nocardioides sp.]HEX3932256.1 holo-ACP synthase [Nocardioides sp.]